MKTSYLVPKILYQDGIKGLSLVRIENRIVEVSAFDRETEQTVYIPSPVAVLDSDRVDEFVMDDIEMVVSKGLDDRSYKRLDDYLRSSSLYYDENLSGSGPVLIMLTETGCQLLLSEN